MPSMERKPLPHFPCGPASRTTGGYVPTCCVPEYYCLCVHGYQCVWAQDTQCVHGCQCVCVLLCGCGQGAQCGCLQSVRAVRPPERVRGLVPVPVRAVGPPKACAGMGAWEDPVPEIANKHATKHPYNTYRRMLPVTPP
eukprot:scaffold95880_cov22-Tisochrysis_lutea.AAC.1